MIAEEPQEIEVMNKRKQMQINRNSATRTDIYEGSLKKLLLFCEREEWRGYDPYDGLNSKIFQALPVKDKYSRLACIQLLKRSPLNLRKLFLIGKGLNPKGLGLFASGYSKLYERSGVEQYRSRVVFLLDLLEKLSLKKYRGYCWGYDFDWQSAVFFIPQGTPNLVCTSFIVNAFLDGYEALKNKRYIQIARSSCDFILRDLNVTRRNEAICFSYSPLDNAEIHNANLLAAALLARVYSLTGEQKLLEFATNAVRFSVKYQNEDGSWYYGNLLSQRWIDNFHTGFNLVALKDYIDFSESRHFRSALEKGFRYYKENFFLKDGRPKYYHDQIYPIDIHSVAQSIVTLAKLEDSREDDISEASRTAQWGIENMQDERGFFYYQKHKCFTNKIPYIRWSQAWMFYALALLLSSEGG